MLMNWLPMFSTLSKKRLWVLSLLKMGWKTPLLNISPTAQSHSCDPWKRQYYRHCQEPRGRWRQLPWRDPRRRCGCWRWSVTWLWEWLHKCTHWSKLIQMQTWKGLSLLVNWTSACFFFKVEALHINSWGPCHKRSLNSSWMVSHHRCSWSCACLRWPIRSSCI